jgi:hypothetical protein
MRVSQFHLLGRRQTLSESVSRRGALDLFQRELARGCLRARAAHGMSGVAQVRSITGTWLRAPNTYTRAKHSLGVKLLLRRVLVLWALGHGQRARQSDVLRRRANRHAILSGSDSPLLLAHVPVRDLSRRNRFNTQKRPRINE